MIGFLRLAKSRSKLSIFRISKWYLISRGIDLALRYCESWREIQSKIYQWSESRCCHRMSDYQRKSTTLITIRWLMYSDAWQSLYLSCSTLCFSQYSSTRYKKLSYSGNMADYLLWVGALHHKLHSFPNRFFITSFILCNVHEDAIA